MATYLVGNGERGQQLLDFYIGRRVGLQIYLVIPDIEKIKFAIGGGNIILDNGDYVTIDP